MTSHIRTSAAPLEPRVPARYYARLAELLTSLGIDASALLHSIGLRLSDLEAPEATLSLSQLESLMASLASQKPDSALPFLFGRSLKPSAHSVVGYGMLSSPSVDHALRFCSRYFKLVMPSFRMRYRSGGGTAELVFEPVLPMSHWNLHFHLEAIAVAAYSEVRDLMPGRLPPALIQLSIPEPTHLPLYTALENTRWRFLPGGEPSARLTYQADFTRHVPTMSDHTALRIAETQCRALLKGRRGQTSVADWAQMIVREVRGAPRLDDLARTLNRSSRTLDRYLRREGVSFRELVTTERMEKACQLLESGESSITEIALELGYRDASNFTRMFRRHTGLSPSRWRATRGPHLPQSG